MRQVTWSLVLVLACACTPPRGRDRGRSGDDGDQTADAGGDSNPDDGGTVTPDDGGTVSVDCGNGVIDPGETCDRAIPAGTPGACPATAADCDDQNSCTVDRVAGSVAACTAHCTHDFASCQSGDRCCPGGCTHDTDSDCPVAATCGNGIIDDGETCDSAIPPGFPGACPTAADCNDGNVCTTDTLVGSAGQCTARCVSTATTACVSGDGCCPAGCTAAADSDCAGCGNGRVDPGEACDPAIPPGFPGACPTSSAACQDGDACTVDGVVGSAASCSAECTHARITACSGTGQDGCCPAGCTSATDADCAPVGCNPACASGQHCDTSSGTCVTDPPKTGHACVADADCGANAYGAGFCWSEAVFGRPGGYCTYGCLTDADCGAGDVCLGGDGFLTDGLCYAGCTSNAGCRGPDYGCYDAQRSGQNVCWPVGDGSHLVGTPCTSTHDCAGGPYPGGDYAECLTNAVDAMPGGYCSVAIRAADGVTCPAGSHKVVQDTATGDGICMADCNTNGQQSTCRSGYYCLDVDGDGQNECVRYGSGQGAVGAACSTVQLCSGGSAAFCFGDPALWTGGYCTVRCAGVAPVAGCPGGSTCVAFNDGNSYCLATCSTAVASCRTGYSCQDMSGAGSGPDACYP